MISVLFFSDVFSICAIDSLPVGRQRFLFQRHRRSSFHREERSPIKVQAVVQQHVALFHGCQSDADNGRRRMMYGPHRRRRARRCCRLSGGLMINRCLRHRRRILVGRRRRRSRITVSYNDAR